MSFFQVSYNDAQDFSPVPPGTYEVIISATEAKTTSTGKPMLTLTHTIREDVDQPAKKRKLFDNLVVTEKAMFRFQNIAKATKMPEGAVFNTPEDVVQAFGRHLKGQALKIVVKHDPNNERFPEQVAGYSESKLAGGTVAGANPFQNGGPEFPAETGVDGPPWADGKPIDISDDDLPF